MATSLPMGSGLTPGENTNWRKLSAYQCHSSPMSGRSRKLVPITRSDTMKSGLAPCLSMSRPSRGEVSDPMAAKDREALTAERDQPKASSKGSTKRPKA